MISFGDLQNILANTFLDGNVEIAGMVMYGVALLIVFGLTKSVFHALVIGLVVTMIFSLLGILSAELTILLIIVSVLGLAYTSRNIWRD